MNKLKEILKNISFKRWQLSIAILLIILIVLIKMIVIPVAYRQISDGKDIVKKLEFLNTANTLDSKLLAIKNRTAKVDSLINMSDNRDTFSEPVIIEKIYSLADSAGCNISKVQIEEPVVLDLGLEIPVMLKCVGDYESIGKFTDGIENMNLATRVRQFSLKKISSTRGEVTLEFVIMENKGVANER